MKRNICLLENYVNIACLFLYYSIIDCFINLSNNVQILIYESTN